MTGTPFARVRPPRPAVVGTLAALYGVTLTSRMPLRLQRRLLDLAALLAPLPPGTVHHPLRLGDRIADRVTVGATERPRAVLYLHGGGYTLGSPGTHRALAAALARDARAVVYLPAYRLAPEFPYPAALDDAVAGFTELVERHGYPPERIALAGDSAGGGLALAAARRLLDARGWRAGALVLLSPWADPGDEEVSRRRDLAVNVGWGQRSASAYLGGGDRFDPGFAPALGELAGLPPTLLHIGNREVLYGQALRLVERLRSAGVPTELHEYPRLWHSAHTQAGLVREVDEAVREVGRFIYLALRAAPADQQQANGA